MNTHVAGLIQSITNALITEEEVRALTTYVLTVSVTTLRTGVLIEAGEGSIGEGDSKDSEGRGIGGIGEGGGGRVGGERIGTGGGVRGRFPGPDLAAGVLGAGVLGSEFGTTLLITLVMDRDKLV